MIGPKKFVAYAEDIDEEIDTFAINHHLYADDTQLQSHLSIADVHAGRLNI